MRFRGAFFAPKGAHQTRRWNKLPQRPFACLTYMPLAPACHSTTVPGHSGKLATACCLQRASPPAPRRHQPLELSSCCDQTGEEYRYYQTAAATAPPTVWVLPAPLGSRRLASRSQAGAAAAAAPGACSADGVTAQRLVGQTAGILCLHVPHRLLACRPVPPRLRPSACLPATQLLCPGPGLH